MEDNLDWTAQELAGGREWYISDTDRKIHALLSGRVPLNIAKELKIIMREDADEAERNAAYERNERD